MVIQLLTEDKDESFILIQITASEAYKYELGCSFLGGVNYQEEEVLPDCGVKRARISAKVNQILANFGIKKELFEGYKPRPSVP